MPAYKDKVKRMTPKQFARYILSRDFPQECICKNCKWWVMEDEALARFFSCHNSIVQGIPRVPTPVVPPETFGCNQWEKKEE